MGDYILLFLTIAIVWLAFSLSNLYRSFTAFHRDYRRVHHLEDL